MDGKPKLLKQDVQGRVRTPVERREQLLEEFGRSGLSGPKFAELVGVKYQTFAGWMHERRKKRPAVAAMPASAAPSESSHHPASSQGIAALQSHQAPSASEPHGKGHRLHIWPMLGVYLEDGRVEIDNNLVENAIRPTAIGKKNWLFVGEANAGQRSAIIYSIIESCRRRGIDPHAYLRDVLTRLPHLTNRQIKDITPEAWGQGVKIEALKAAA